MAQHVHPASLADQALVHQFIRQMGRSPTAEELARYQTARSRRLRHHADRLRRAAARLVARL